VNPLLIFQIVLLIISILVAVLMRPSGATQVSEEPVPGELSTPEIDAASPVPVLFGTRFLSESNCVWYGDVEVEPIIKCMSS
jgi:hypothetical protein